MRLSKLFRRVIGLVLIVSLLFGGYKISLAKIYSDAKQIVETKGTNIDFASIKQGIIDTASDTADFASEYADSSASDLSIVLEDHSSAIDFSNVGNEISSALNGKFGAVKSGASAAKDYIGTIVINDTEQESSSDVTEDLTITFLAVNGDCILLQCGGESAMIDAGDNGDEELVLDYLEKQGISDLDFLILTHPDADHIGGAAEVLSSVNVDMVYMPTAENKSVTYESVIKVIEEKGITAKAPVSGDTFEFSNSVVNVLSPEQGVTYEDVNDFSICVKISLGSTSFITTGDASTEIEEALLKKYGYEFLDADVLKLGHHGSNTSSSEEFFNGVSPEDGIVISVGLKNEYGHPYSSVLREVKDLGDPMYRTDLQGTLTCVMNGESVLFNTDPCCDFRSGEELE